MLLLAALFLLFPALLIHLGLIAFYDDEGIRSLVALEMLISGNYITPTLFGEFYYNKPPLYNWILLVVFELTGRNDEFIARLPTVFFLVLYATTVAIFSSVSLVPEKNSTSTIRSAKPAFGITVALAFITCGRILFWDSMLALIDICFSWVMYLLFMVIYRDGEKARYKRLFPLAYFLTAAGFMLKGLPSVVFLGIALLTYFVWQKKIRILFSGWHIVGVGVFLTIVGGYYVMYARHNGLETVFETLFHESAKRTLVAYGIDDTLLHLLTFPFEMWYHFLPWTLLVVYFFRKNAWRWVKENKFVSWNLLVLVTTILPYWSSVEVYPRYLFMHVPLAFTALFYLHEKNKTAAATLTKVIETVFGVVCVLVIPATFGMLWWEPASETPHLYLKVAALAAAFATLTVGYWKWRTHRMWIFVLVLLVARIGFNWFVLPSRLAVECSTEVRSSTLEVVARTKNSPVYIYGISVGFQPLTGYYYTRETGKILRPVEEGQEVPGAYYILDPMLYNPNIMEEVMRFTMKWECRDLVLGYKK